MRSLGGGRWQCLECGFQSKSTNVKYHIESKHLKSTAVYQCEQCHETMKTRNALNTHMSTKHRLTHGYWTSRPPNWCYSNEFVVGVDTEIKSKMVKFGNMWQCSDCDYSSSKSSNLYRHVESKHVETQFYPCPKCGKHFKGSNSYSVHMYRCNLHCS